MVKRKIIWTKDAIKERTEIYNYWNKRNKSKKYSQKLHHLFTKFLKLLKTNPELGILNKEFEFRYLIVKQYLIFYSFNDSEIIVLKIWEAHQNPEKLEIDI